MSNNQTHMLVICDTVVPGPDAAQGTESPEAAPSALPPAARRTPCRRPGVPSRDGFGGSSGLPRCGGKTGRLPAGATGDWPRHRYELSCWRFRSWTNPASPTLGCLPCETSPRSKSPPLGRLHARSQELGRVPEQTGPLPRLPGRDAGTTLGGSIGSDHERGRNGTGGGVARSMGQNQGDRRPDAASPATTVTAAAPAAAAH